MIKVLNDIKDSLGIINAKWEGDISISEINVEIEEILRKYSHIKIVRSSELFVGRSDEITILVELLKPNSNGVKERKPRIITLCGEGGIGKTRLAQAAADNLSEIKEFPGGIFEVACDGMSDARNIVLVILQTMGISSVEGIQQPEKMLVDLLRRQEKNILFVLDGLDELFSPSKDASDIGMLLKEFITASSGLMILTTCRHPLNMGSDEHIFPVDPMNYQDAVELFTMCVPDQEIQVELREILKGQQAILLGCIVKLTAGMPLCIILAARRLLRHGENLETLLEGLANRMVETMNDPKLNHLPDRLKSLRASLNLSYDRLSESAKEFFVRMGFFPGGLYRGFAGLSELLGSEWMDAAEEATNYALIRYERETRHYIMLRPVFEYAHEKLDESSEICFIQRVLEFWAGFSIQFGAIMMEIQPFAKDYSKKLLDAVREQGRQVTSDDLRLKSMFEFTIEFENLLYATKWALERGNETGLAIFVGLEQYLSVKGLWYIEDLIYQLALQCLHKLLKTDFPKYSPMLIRILYRRGLLLDKIGNAKEALRLYSEALDLCNQLSKSNPDACILHSIASIHDNTGTLYRKLRQFDKALTHCQEALSIYKRLSESSPDEYIGSLAITLNNMGNIYVNMDCYDEALKYHREALVIRRKLFVQHSDIHHESELAMSLLNIGGVYAKMECFNDALVSLQEALDMYRELTKLYPKMYKPFLAHTLSNMGFILKCGKVNRLNESEAKYDEALEIYTEFFRQYPLAYIQQYSFALINAIEVYQTLDLKDKLAWCKQEIESIKALYK
jgi:tetratricopeptide (TPR) repeat protein